MNVIGSREVLESASIKYMPKIAEAVNGMYDKWAIDWQCGKLSRALTYHLSRRAF